MSVGSVCVLGEPWLELCTSQTAAPTATARYCYAALRVTETLPSNFPWARFDYLLNKGQFSTLSPQSAGLFPKIRCESREFRAKG